MRKMVIRSLYGNDKYSVFPIPMRLINEKMKDTYIHSTITIENLKEEE